MDAQTALFQQHRQRLFGLAYRMLGRPADAEDVLHDAWLRWHDQDVDALDDPEAWLVTVTTRLSLDRLRRAKTERAHYTGPWLPEPLTEDFEAIADDEPSGALERAESLSLSFLLILERLSAEERAAFLLREVFDYSHAEVASMLDMTEDACRQRVHRAKVRLKEDRPRFQVDPAQQRRMLQRFIEAMEKPTLASLQALFAEDAIHVADGGGLASATLRPLHGAERLARLYLQIANNTRPYAMLREIRMLNGVPAIFQWLGDQLTSVMWIESDGDKITGTLAIRHPEKLARIAAVTNPPAAASLH
ncbi:MULTISPECIES: RNA polymerase sigma factor SigJ [Dyella]|uniref:Sigma-70 family RNA polymerase sigma factor n=2 Tax=Dyella TaxID=231454 RepID=A0A4R0Z1W6_9GAMM|nr:MULTISPECIES: RNA polymerase sigma factor SigJ [Dyella]TBR39000.1 sigma-70 family RNA polymerase sigma factor [Dyella terrae]TCI13408.1 sigma-70 family RNA polymerase sigma factor [Dyella soli]